MVDYIKKIEQATDNSIIPLIYLLLNSSYIAASWNNHDVKRGAAPIDFEYHQRLRNVAIAKLLSFEISKDKLPKWYDLFGARIKSFGFFKDYICSQIIDGTISKNSLARLFSKDKKIFNNELDRIADEYSDVDCALAREAGYSSYVPFYSAGDQLVPLERKYEKNSA